MKIGLLDRLVKASADPIPPIAQRTGTVHMDLSFQRNPSCDFVAAPGKCFTAPEWPRVDRDTPGLNLPR
jgi:hypothetical protein